LRSGPFATTSANAMRRAPDRSRCGVAEAVAAPRGGGWLSTRGTRRFGGGLGRPALGGWVGGHRLSRRYWIRRADCWRPGAIFQQAPRPCWWPRSPSAWGFDRSACGLVLHLGTCRPAPRATCRSRGRGGTRWAAGPCLALLFDPGRSHPACVWAERGLDCGSFHRRRAGSRKATPPGAGQQQLRRMEAVAERVKPAASRRLLGWPSVSSCPPAVAVTTLQRRQPSHHWSLRGWPRCFWPLEQRSGLISAPAWPDALGHGGIRRGSLGAGWLAALVQKS